MLDSKLQPISIDHLPTELLAIIFKIVHWEYQQSTYGNAPAANPYDTTWFSDEGVISPTRFPSALARVCPLWHTIMSSVPTFWTQLVIVVDTSSQHPVTLSDIRSSLRFARDLILDIVITRRPGSPIPDSSDERLLLAPLIALVAPQIQRCRSFSFYAIHSSALPLIGNDIRGSAPFLEDLKLECDIDDRGGNLARDDGPIISSPLLSKLVINGHNFINTSRHDPKWLTKFPRLSWLTISCLSPEAGGYCYEKHISFRTFIGMVASEDLDLEYLRICDFNPGEDDLPPSDLDEGFDLELGGKLVLEDLSASFIRQFSLITSLYAEELCISRCPLIGSIPFTETLTLEDLDISNDLAQNLRDWPGSVLILKRCPSFDDGVLNMMGDPDILRDFDNSPNSLAKLILIDCPNFTVEALKRMVDVRNEEVDGFFQYYGPPVVEGIKVYGRGPSLTSADATWFGSKLRYLDWHTELPDGGMSVMRFGVEDQVDID